MPAPHAKVIAGYEAAAPDLIDRFSGIDPQDAYQHVREYLDACAGKTLLDIGAGVGRNAAWLADLGFEVTAVEPVNAFRVAGRQAFPKHAIRWMNDRLPALAELRDLEEQFDIITLTAVWHHLLDAERLVALRRLAGLCKIGGYLILSLRHGPGAPDRPCYPIDVDATVTQAERNGFECLLRKDAQSIQSDNRQNGIVWTWIVLRRTN